MSTLYGVFLESFQICLADLFAMAIILSIQLVFVVVQG
jgi:hypothetical protein